MLTRTLKTSLMGVIVIAILFVLSGRSGEACGPFFLDAIFTYAKHPDIPLDKFVQGQIGVVKPSYARSYLFAAYRQMQGASFDPGEQGALQELWKERLDLSWDAPEDEWIKPWLDARSKVAAAGPAPKISLYRNREKPNEYESYLNCQQDAFATAAATLNERMRKFSADSSELKDWIRAQDTVFSNCSEGHTIPDAATAGEPLLRADRSYQIAAANFYAGSFGDAENQYVSIAHDSSSPWRPTAEYMIARTFLRQASLGKDEDKQGALSKAETQLKQILNDKNLSSQHHASARLLNLVRLRLHPEQKLHELAGAIMQKKPGEGLKQDVWDYTVLLDKIVGEDAEEATVRKEIPAAVTQDDVSDWIVTFQNSYDRSLEHALQRFEQTSSLPWLVAVLSKVDAKNPKTASLLAAASKVDHHSPAFDSVAFYRVRLLMEAGKDEEARNILDEILGSDRTQMPPSAVNMFVGLRMILARSAEEFLRDAPRPPAGFSYDEDGREIPVEPKEVEKPKEETSLLFDQDSTTFLNEHAPLSLLLNAATARSLPTHLRRDVAQAAWLRAALLDRREESTRLIPVLSGFYPSLKELLATYQAANTAEARRFTAAYIALKFPGLRPTVTPGLGRSTPISEVDSFRDNWWCLAASPRLLEADVTADQETNTPKSSTQKLPGFLSPSEQAAAVKEVATLNALGVAPNYLSRTVIEWANRNPADPRVPEALHLAVTSTRRGCTDKETGRWSKAAFDLLHRRYPNSPWTRKTKYWFKD